MNTTPMMTQYERIKRLHKDAVLFFRLGDFYEMFQDDAREVSVILGLTLTHRQGVPMCGIPYHSSRTYIERLLKAGKKIAVCEQMRMTKGLAERDVVEVISPGTVVDEDYLERSLNNYIVSVAEVKKGFSLSAVDISTGDFMATWLPPAGREEGLRKELCRLSPREILAQEAILDQDGEAAKAIRSRKDLVVTTLPDWGFDRETCLGRLKNLFGVANLKGFGLTDEAPEILSAGALIEYLEENAKNRLRHIRNFRVYTERDYLVLDESTLRNLELTRNLQDGGEKYSLMDVVNHTKTAMGARLLRSWLLSPLVNAAAIRRRQDAVEFLYRDQARLKRLRDGLGGIFDIERLSARLALDKAHAKDLCAVRDSLISAFTVSGELEAAGKKLPPETLASLAELRSLLERSLADSPSILLTEGNLIRPGFDEELDKLRSLRSNSKAVLDAYIGEEKKSSGIPSLKIRYNRIIGWFIEVTKTYAGSVPAHFIRRQSLGTGIERYSTARLIEIETALNNAEGSIIELEKELFLKVRGAAKDRLRELQDISAFLAEMDALQSLAQTAALYGYTKPVVTENGAIKITEGRHPVVEKYLPPGEFIPNGLKLASGGKSFALITGPNMAGKSTYLRQTALIVILAQTGSFVPAREAEIGIVDKIFCRVGAQDNLARGESTFLVEMNETANILRAATPESLVIMDEVGRGTSTNDGLSIAWAVCEHILDRLRAKTLFATHYHELSGLKHSALFNLSMEIREEKGSIVFLKRVKDGPSNNSYGIHVARLAGLPPVVLDRASVILENLSAKEEEPPIPAAEKSAGQGTLFSNSEMLETEVRSYPVDKATPVEALAFLRRWKKILG